MLRPEKGDRHPARAGFLRFVSHSGAGSQSPFSSSVRDPKVNRFKHHPERGDRSVNINNLFMLCVFEDSMDLTHPAGIGSSKSSSSGPLGRARKPRPRAATQKGARASRPGSTSQPWAKPSGTARRADDRRGDPPSEEPRGPTRRIAERLPAGDRPGRSRTTGRPAPPARPSTPVGSSPGIPRGAPRRGRGGRGPSRSPRSRRRRPPGR